MDGLTQQLSTRLAARSSRGGFLRLAGTAALGLGLVMHGASLTEASAATPLSSCPCGLGCGGCSGGQCGSNTPECGTCGTNGCDPACCTSGQWNCCSAATGYCVQACAECCCNGQACHCFVQLCQSCHSGYICPCHEGAA